MQISTLVFGMIAKKTEKFHLSAFTLDELIENKKIQQL